MVVRYAVFSKVPLISQELEIVFTRVPEWLYCMPDVKRDTKSDSSRLEEESQDFASQMFSSSLFVVHDTARGCHHNVTEKQAMIILS